MYRGNRVGVVVPAHNEAAFVGEVLRSMPEFVDKVYAVDDGSADDTWSEILAAAGDGEESTTILADGSGFSDGLVVEGPADRLVAVRHAHNRGVGAAIKTGYRLARRDGMDVTTVVSGDGQMDPDILDRIIHPVATGRADYAKGDRLSNPEHRAGMSGWRLFGNTLLTGLTRLASGYWGLSDPQNGYTAISGTALDRLSLESLYDRYGFANDLLVRLNAADLRITDVPMAAVYGDERSGIRYRTFVPVLSWLLLHRFGWRLWTRYVRREFRPFVLAFPLGAGAAVLGLPWLVTSLLGPGGVGPPLAVLLLSVCLLVAGFLGDMAHSSHLEAVTAEGSV